MKTCDEYQEMMSAYIDQELNDNETSQLFYHLSECLECREFMKSLLTLHSAFRDSDASQSKKPTSLWERKLSLSFPAAAVITFAMLLSGILFFEKMNQPPKVVQKIQTEYVYMTSFPPVYATIGSPNDVKSN